MHGGAAGVWVQIKLFISEKDGPGPHHRSRKVGLVASVREVAARAEAAAVEAGTKTAGAGTMASEMEAAERAAEAARHTPARSFSCCGSCHVIVASYQEMRGHVVVIASYRHLRQMPVTP